MGAKVNAGIISPWNVSLGKDPVLNVIIQNPWKMKAVRTWFTAMNFVNVLESIMIYLHWISKEFLVGY